MFDELSCQILNTNVEVLAEVFLLGIYMILSVSEDDVQRPFLHFNAQNKD